MTAEDRAIMNSPIYWGESKWGDSVSSPNTRMRNRWVNDGRTDLERADSLRGFYLVWDTMTLDKEDRRMNLTGPLMAEVARRWSQLLLAKASVKPVSHSGRLHPPCKREA